MCRLLNNQLIMDYTNNNLDSRVSRKKTKYDQGLFRFGESLDRLSIDDLATRLSVLLDMRPEEFLHAWEQRNENLMMEVICTAFDVLWNEWSEEQREEYITTGDVK